MSTKKCASCNGNGECSHCGGLGYKVDLVNYKCSRCGGSGTCPACNGSGEVEVD